MKQSAEFTVFRVLKDLPWGNRGQQILGFPSRRVRGYMVDIDPLVAAARC